MLTHSTSCTATAQTTLGFVDFTDQVQEAVSRCGIAEGRVTIVRRDEGCTLIVNERERGLHADVQATIQRLSETNGDGPLRVGSATLVLPVVGGRIHLGTWQRLLMLELDEPRERAIEIQVVGE